MSSRSFIPRAAGPAPAPLSSWCTHVRKSIGRHEIGSAFRGSSALHAVGDSYLLLTRPAPQLATYRAAVPVSLCGFAASTAAPTRSPHSLVLLNREAAHHGGDAAKGRKDRRHTSLADVGDKVRYNQLRDQIMMATECSKRTAQLAIAEACQQGWMVQANGKYHLPL